MSPFSRLSLSRQLSALTVLIIGPLLLAMLWAFSGLAQQVAQRQATQALQQTTDVMAAILRTAESDLKTRTALLSKALQSTLSGQMQLGARSVIIGDKPVPELLLNGQTLSGDYAIPDRFTQSTGAVATLFARQGDDFVRVSTSLKTQEGKRAVATQLDRQHPGYAAVLGGKNFTGVATLFGTAYMTQYEPIRDAGGRVIGLSFVGLNFDSFLAELKQTIRGIKVGETGYFYVLDATNTLKRGNLIVHPASEGKNLLDAKDADGRLFIQDMLADQQGTIEYPWVNPSLGETEPRNKVVAYQTLPGIGWLIAGGTYLDELTADIQAASQTIMLAGLVAVGLLALGTILLLNRALGRPLEQAVETAVRLSQGDLGARMNAHDRHDEIGRLATAMNSIGTSLTGIVGGVRASATQVQSATQEISAGNADLSTRTERQASAVEETVATLESLDEVVRQNAKAAQESSDQAQDAREKARHSGRVVGEVILTMKGIHESSSKISNIVSVIDGIAFQTNILALNASVEAARAGELGRGFAVVASEVRALANRSAEAAKEISGLIHETVGKAEAGAGRVDEAERALLEVDKAIEQLAIQIKAISEAGQEQSRSVRETHAVMSDMDQVTQQNAALVEEMAAAAKSLDDLARGLVSAVSQFRSG